MQYIFLFNQLFYEKNCDEKNGKLIWMGLSILWLFYMSPMYVTEMKVTGSNQPTVLASTRGLHPTPEAGPGEVHHVSC